jgi:glutamate-5-semialdehyde dehydrogenase
MNSGDVIKVLVGDRLVDLPSSAAVVVKDGGRLIPLRKSGEVLVVDRDVRQLVDVAVEQAAGAFADMQSIEATAVDDFFRRFADAIDNDDTFAPVLEANASDVASAKERGRATGRLELSEKMRSDMAAGLRMWADLQLDRLGFISSVAHDGWSVESWRAPLGVVAFVFEGRPNVFADATGVLKSGNSVVFRIGSDALGTARAIRDNLLNPSLLAAGLPAGVVQLVDSPEHSAGWALFDDSRLAIAVARGSGPAVNQLGEIARQVGTPVSLHGTGGAWLVVGSSFDAERLRSFVENSLDRKVCNTLNTMVLLESGFSESLRAVGPALERIATNHGGRLVVHCRDARVIEACKGLAGVDTRREDVDPGHEWEWDDHPELTIITSTSIDDAVSLFNSHSPRFVLSVVTNVASEEEAAWAASDAPFFGNGFTRWVDGQFALSRPELGLANWQSGRLLGRGGVLSGDSVHTVRLRVRQDNHHLRR